MGESGLCMDCQQHNQEMSVWMAIRLYERCPPTMKTNTMPPCPASHRMTQFFHRPAKISSLETLVGKTLQTLVQELAPFSGCVQQMQASVQDIWPESKHTSWTQILQ